MKAHFIDGKTSKRRDCDLIFLQDSITITYVDDNAIKTVSSWQISEILNIDILTSSRTLKHGDFPHEVLEFESLEDFNYIIQQYPDAIFHQSTYNKFTAFGWKGIVSAIVGIALVSLLFFFYGAPMLADVFARSIPREYETWIGENFQQTYLQYLTVDEDKSNQIQRFYDHLEYQSEYDVSVVVVESDMVNAFALPGGFIVVFSGILDIMEDENELAALLAHEASHINGRHSLRIISRDLAMYVLLASLTGDVGGFSSVLIENSNLISSLSFSREFEKEADLEGLNLMIEAEIDPNGMLRLFEKFELAADSDEDAGTRNLTVDSALVDISVDSGSSWNDFPWEKVTELLSTHPAPKNRIKYLKEEIANLDNGVQFGTNDSLNYYFKQLKEN